MASTRSSSNGDSVFQLLVDNNVVGLSTWETVEDAGNILLVGPCNWSISELDSEELDHVRTFLNRSLLLSKTHLSHIHNLDTVVAKLRTNQDIVLVATDFLPERVFGDVGWGWSAVLLVGKFFIRRTKELTGMQGEPSSRC